MYMGVRWLGIEPRSTAWKSAMLTITQPTLQLLGINLKSNIFADLQCQELVTQTC